MLSLIRRFLLPSHLLPFLPSAFPHCFLSSFLHLFVSSFLLFLVSSFLHFPVPWFRGRASFASLLPWFLSPFLQQKTNIIVWSCLCMLSCCEYSFIGSCYHAIFQTVIPAYPPLDCQLLALHAHTKTECGVPCSTVWRIHMFSRRGIQCFWCVITSSQANTSRIVSQTSSYHCVTMRSSLLEEMMEKHGQTQSPNSPSIFVPNRCLQHCGEPPLALMV